ncbi:MAG: hypothetical protein ACE5F1_16530 [Planctomycetota bacterium]
MLRSANMRQAPALRSLLLPSSLASVLAILCYLPALSGGFLSDDSLLNFFLDHESHATRVRWAEVLRDFGRPWVGIEGLGLYRPIVSLSYGIDLCLGKGEPFFLHASNVLAHALASFCCAMLAAIHCPERPRLAALLGGAVFALHPIAVEPTAWIAGRTSCIEGCFRLAATLAFAVYLRAPRFRWLLWTMLFTGLALLTKESAAVLPLFLLAVDLLHECPPRWRALLRRQLRFLPVWIGYVLLRSWALDGSLGPLAGNGAAPLHAFLLSLPGKFGAVLVPGSSWTRLLLLLLLMPLLVRAWLRARHTFLLGGCLLWMLGDFLSGFHMRVGPELGGSRLIYGSVLVLAVLLTRIALDAPDSAQRTRSPLPLIGLCVLPLAFGWLARQRLADYRESWDVFRSVRSELARLGRRASPEHPLAVVTTPSEAHGITLVRADSVFTLAERPLADADHPVLGLNFVAERFLDSAGLFQDVSPLRAMQEFGASLLYWQNGRFRSEAVPDAELPPLKRDGRARFRFARPVSPYRIEALRLTVEGSVEGGTLRWLTESPRNLRELRFGRGRPVGRRTVFLIDLSHSWTFLAHQLARGIPGFEIDLDRGSAPILELVALPRLMKLDLNARLEGRRAKLTSLPLVAPELPVEGLELRVVLLGPHAGHAQDAVPGAPLRLEASVLRKFQGALRSSRQKRVYYYFEALGSKGTSIGAARSEVDWFTADIREDA